MKERTSASAPVTAAVRTAGGKPVWERSSSSSRANQAGSQRMRACSTGEGEAVVTTVPSSAAGRTRAAALSQRRRAASGARRESK